MSKEQKKRVYVPAPEAIRAAVLKGYGGLPRPKAEKPFAQVSEKEVLELGLTQSQLQMNGHPARRDGGSGRKQIHRRLPAVQECPATCTQGRQLASPTS